MIDTTHMGPLLTEWVRAVMIETLEDQQIDYVLVDDEIRCWASKKDTVRVKHIVLFKLESMMDDVMNYAVYEFQGSPLGGDITSTQ